AGARRGRRHPHDRLRRSDGPWAARPTAGHRVARVPALVRRPARRQRVLPALRGEGLLRERRPAGPDGPGGPAGRPGFARRAESRERGPDPATPLGVPVGFRITVLYYTDAPPLPLVDPTDEN